MSEINHHLPDGLLMAYASGNLSEGFALVVATHVSMCDACRARMQGFEAVGGALLDEGDADPLPDAALEQALARLSDAPDDSLTTPAGSTFPVPLSGYLNCGLADVAWKSVAGGVKQAVIKTDDDTRVRLFSIPGGAAMPDHGHRGMELTLVLKGAFLDDGDRFGRGDIEVADEELDHTPVAEAGEPCICLAATDAPLRFRGWLPRLAQPFLGI